MAMETTQARSAEAELHFSGKKMRDPTRVSVGGWLGTIVLSGIPVVNLIFWLIWAFSAKKPSRKTYAIAMLILTALIAAGLCAAVMFLGRQIVEWARALDPETFRKLLEGAQVPAA